MTICGGRRTDRPLRVIVMPGDLLGSGDEEEGVEMSSSWLLSCGGYLPVARYAVLRRSTEMFSVRPFTSRVKNFSDVEIILYGPS